MRCCCSQMESWWWCWVDVHQKKSFTLLPLPVLLTTTLKMTKVFYVVSKSMTKRESSNCFPHDKWAERERVVVKWDDGNKKSWGHYYLLSKYFRNNFGKHQMGRKDHKEQDLDNIWSWCDSCRDLIIRRRRRRRRRRIIFVMRMREWCVCARCIWNSMCSFRIRRKRNCCRCKEKKVLLEVTRVRGKKKRRMRKKNKEREDEGRQKSNKTRTPDPREKNMKRRSRSIIMMIPGGSVIQKEQPVAASEDAAHVLSPVLNRRFLLVEDAPWAEMMRWFLLPLLFACCCFCSPPRASSDFIMMIIRIHMQMLLNTSGEEDKRRGWHSLCSCLLLILSCTFLLHFYSSIAISDFLPFFCSFSLFFLRSGLSSLQLIIIMLPYLRVSWGQKPHLLKEDMQKKRRL